MYLYIHPSLLQTWKNETVAEQEKRLPQERPILLSKDIESKLALLDREVNYLLNKAKFAKPKAKAKAKNSTSSDKSNNTSEEKIIPPTEEEKTTPPTGAGTEAESGGWISSPTPETVGNAEASTDISSRLFKAESTVESQPGEAPPTAENTIHAETESPPQPTEETTPPGQPVRPAANNAGEL